MRFLPVPVIPARLGCPRHLCDRRERTPTRVAFTVGSTTPPRVPPMLAHRSEWSQCPRWLLRLMSVRRPDVPQNFQGRISSIGVLFANKKCKSTPNFLPPWLSTAFPQIL